MRIFHTNTRLLFCKLLILSLLSGCASTSTSLSSNDDPWEPWNHSVHDFNNDVSNNVLNPVRKKYASVMPEWFMTGTSNFFSNIKDIGVTINDLMQLKVEQSSMDGGRFLINTTAGVVGLVDVASMMDLTKHNEGFDQTLSYWGVPSGNYLVMPFLGPSSPREIAGILGDTLLNPLTYTFAFSASGAVLGYINSGTQALATPLNSNLNLSENDTSETLKDNYKLNKDIHLYQSSRKSRSSDEYASEQDGPKYYPHVFISPE
ncbi:MAG: VacJ family lipoprotein [Methylococcales bacterium]